MIDAGSAADLLAGGASHSLVPQKIGLVPNRNYC